MNAADTSQTDSAAMPPADSDNEPIAMPDRLMVAMFLIVGSLLGIIMLLDLFIGFFR